MTKRNAHAQQISTVGALPRKGMCKRLQMNFVSSGDTILSITSFLLHTGAVDKYHGSRGWCCGLGVCVFQSKTVRTTFSDLCLHGMS